MSLNKILITLVIILINSNAYASKKTKKACNESDVKVAINHNNKDFPGVMDKCADKAWKFSGFDVRIDVTEATECLIKKYPKLSEDCATCFGEMADCSASNCKFKCIGNHFSDKCINCVDEHCRGLGSSKFDISACTGLKESKLPPKK